ncbi:MAG: hypothetical protein KDC10_07515 [Calditrichaeota bacterium]|nr:hypothetical protein [Calditrichota bacterium]
MKTKAERWFYRCLGLAVLLGCLACESKEEGDPVSGLVGIWAGEWAGQSQFARFDADGSCLFHSAYLDEPFCGYYEAVWQFADEHLVVITPGGMQREFDVALDGDLLLLEADNVELVYERTGGMPSLEGCVDGSNLVLGEIRFELNGESVTFSGFAMSIDIYHPDTFSLEGGHPGGASLSFGTVPLEAGTHALLPCNNVDGQIQAFYYPAEGGSDHFFDNCDARMNGWISSEGESDGWIEGSFSFDLYDDTGTMVELRNGSFHVPLGGGL